MPAEKPDLLLLTQRIPYPPNKGDKIRHYNVLMYLRRQYRVHLGSVVDDPDDRRHVGTVSSLCASAHLATIDRRVARIACLRGLLTGEALSVAFFGDSGLRRYVASVMDTIRPEAIVVCSSNVAPYVLRYKANGARRVVDLVDVDSEKWRAYAERRSGLGRYIYRREWRRMAALERRIAAECDASTFVSDAEAALFRGLIPEALAGAVHAISNGVDHDYFSPDRDYPDPFGADPFGPDPFGPNPFGAEGGGPHYVFTGTMDYPPNEDAVAWFAGEILPGIRRALPGARFHIVGANPSAPVRRLAEKDGVAVTGRVPDVRPYVAHAAAAVAPMRIARGIQNKVLEAMAMARPVIVTPEGLEGISAEPEREVLVAADAAKFIADAIRLGAPDAAEEAGRLGAAARRRILTDYIWAERLRGFDALLRPAVEESMDA